MARARALLPLQLNFRRLRGRRPLAVAIAAATATIGLVVLTDVHGAGAAPAWSPVGQANGFTQYPGGLLVSGWTYDPSSPATPIVVSISIDGTTASTLTANGVRTDVAKAYPRAGASHGFSRVQLVPEGKHTVCVTARNIGLGADVSLRCETRTMDYGPRGALDLVDTRPGRLHVKGWAVDPDEVTGKVAILVRLDKSAPVTVTAYHDRPDIRSLVHPNAGTQHGFEMMMSASQGLHTVCVTARSLKYGADNSLGCKTVTLNDNPLGYIDVLKPEGGKLRLQGWVLDRDQPATALRVSVRIDNATTTTYLANRIRDDVARAYPGTGRNHGFDELISLPEGMHTVCVTALNLGYGSNKVFACYTPVISFRPTAALVSLTTTSTGVAFSGWATDPDTTGPVKVRITINGSTKATLTADRTGSVHSGNNFAGALPATSGKRTICAIALNKGAGHADSVPSCLVITLNLAPMGSFDTLSRAPGSNDLLVTGWALDPDTSKPTSATVSLDGTTVGTYQASATRTDVAKVYPATGAAHGLSVVLGADDGLHTVCLTAVKVRGTATKSLGCKIANAVNPTAPSAPQSVKANSGYGSSVVSWSAPASNGGAPTTKYTIVASPGGSTVTAAGTATSATVTGLATATSYTFSVTATNVGGTSPAANSPKVTTQSGPAPQQTPAPISTSRYIRNIRGSSAAEQAVLRAEGVADAKTNPSGHRYIVLLDIGGQDQYNGGVVLSATTRFVTYSDLVTDIKAYLDGYASAQRSTAPAMITVGTNNDLDVTAAAGAAWADRVVDPLVSYAKKYTGITISGANDIEPGFRGSYGATKNWLAGYLGATSAQFVFNGSADGCAWTVTDRSCNNGWSMAGLYNLAAGAAPTRMINLPQIYNYTMADQWKYISLTGIGQGQPRINFGGPLTEYTACAQAGSCGSISGSSAWSRMWSNLQSHPSLRVGSLPYSTDLRIDG